MSILIFIAIALVLLGLALYAINSLSPLQPPIRNLLLVVAVLIAIVAIAQKAGMF